MIQLFKALQLAYLQFSIFLILGQPIYLEPNQICLYDSCTQTQSILAGKANIYNYGPDKLGDLSTTNFTISIWIKTKTNSGIKYQIMAIKGSSTKYITTDYQYIYLDSTPYSLATPQNIWLWVYFASIYKNGIYSQEFGQYQEEFNQYWYVKFLSPIAITPTFSIEFLQNSDNQKTGFNSVACCIVLHLNDDAPDWKRQSEQSVMNVDKPQTVLHLKMLERQQSKITKDWSQYQYIPKLGSQYAIQTDSDDPILDVVASSLQFGLGKYIRIDHFNIPNSFSIEIKFSVSNLVQDGQLLVIQNQQYGDVLRVYYFQDSIGLQLQIVWLNQPLVQVINLDTLYWITINFLDLKITNKLLFSGFQRMSNGNYINFTEVKVPNYQYNNKYLQTLIIGDQSISNCYLIDSEFTSGFTLYEFKFNQGFYFMKDITNIQNCLHYQVDRCISCKVGYVVDVNGQCVVQCNTTFEVMDGNHNYCVNLCHTTCLTCSLAIPTDCLTCAGNRVNPPDCECPPLYFDDQVSPNCISNTQSISIEYIPDQSIQSGELQLNCLITDWFTSQINFPQPYLTIPKVVITLTGVRQITQVEFQGFVDIVTLTGFTIKTKCETNLIVQYKWISEQGMNVLGVQQNHMSSGAILEERSIISQANAVTLSSILGLGITSIVLTQFEINMKKLSDSYSGLYTTSPLNLFKYEDIQITNWQYQQAINITLNLLTQNTRLPSAGTQYSITIDQPMSIEFLPLFQGSSQSQGSMMFLQQLHNRNITTLTYYMSTKQLKQVNQIGLQLIFASLNCTNTTGPCNYYHGLSSTCNSIKHNLCHCDQIGYYTDAAGYCLNCDDTCYTCQNTPTQCTGCNPIQLLTLIGGTCQCLSTQFTNIDGICEPCSQFCLTCEFNAYNCLSCPSDQQLIGNECACLDGSYNDTSTAIYTCQQCQQSCHTCSELSSCDSCADGSHKVAPIDYCECEESYFEDENTDCQLCDSNCGTCEFSTANCLSCPPTDNSILVNGICICNSNSYLDENQVCQSCPSSCASCNNFSDCTACNDLQMDIIDGGCLCKSHHYADENSQCQICNSNCLDCEITSDNCISCDPILSQTVISGICICQTNQFVDSNGVCQECSQQCQTCITQPENCVSCMDINRIIINGACICVDGYFNDGSLICQPCNQSCFKCANKADQCTECPIQIKSTLQDGQCNCLVSEYSNINGVCEACSTQCNTCQTSADNCVQCKDSLKVSIQGVCKCIDGYFTTMLGDCEVCDNNCATCSEQSTQCLTCKPLQYLKGTQCQNCHRTCLTCSGAQDYDCLTCGKNKQLNNGMCICIDGYFEDAESNCQKCQYTCSKCANKDKCSQCSGEHFRSVLQPGNSFCTCQQGYYNKIDTQMCQQCHPTCQTCINDKACLTCKPEQFRTLTLDKCSCSDGYFDVGDLICRSCTTPEGMLQKSCKYQDCQDGKWTEAEECDDGNQIPRDGCTNCKIDTNYKCINTLLQTSFCYKCQLNCLECQLDKQIVICNACADGFFLTENRCVACSDNCLTCSSMQVCTKCHIDIPPNDLGRCSKCEIQPGFYTVDGTCQSKCGDQILALNEECDDGNQMNDDGCDINCRIEKSSTCVDNVCSKIPQPPMEVQFVNSTTTNSLVLNMPITDDINEQSISVMIEQFQASEFNYTVSLIKDADNNANFDLNFQFFKTIEESNLIHIIVTSNQVANGSRLLQEIREVIIKPRKQIYYSEDQQAQAQSAQDAQEAFGLALYFIGPTAVLLGGFAFFWTILDIMSWVNNLYYINVFFPENVRLFFENSAWGNISLFPAFIEFNTPEDSYYTESPPKFMQKEVDPLFINNTWMCLSIWAGTILLYFISVMFVSLIDQIYTKPKKSSVSVLNIKGHVRTHQVQLEGSSHNKPYIIQKLYTESMHFKLNIRSTMINSLNLSFLDLVIAVTLQLNTCKTDKIDYVVMFVNFILSLLGFILCWGIIVIAYKVSMKHTKQLTNPHFSNNYGTIYENINTNSRTAMLYSFTNLIRKALFIICEVVFYYNPIFQTMTCSFITFLNVALIVYENPFINKKILIQYGIPDFCIFVLMLLCVGLAIDDKIAYFDADQRFMIGWIILGSIGLSIGVQLYFLMDQFIRNLITNIKLLREKLFN